MASNDRDDFAEQLVRNQHRIFAYVATLVSNRDDAEDVFQNTCLILWKKWEYYSRPHNFFGWACGIRTMKSATSCEQADEANSNCRRTYWRKLPKPA